MMAVVSLMIACGRPDPKTTENTDTVSSPGDYDPNRGLGRFENFEVSAALNHDLAAIGEKITSSKCQSCHKLTEERLVGPGWAGVTKRRTPTWLMNFITEPDPMIDVDPELQSQLELCLVRMPNQNISDDDGKAILEYMRKNDGVQ